MKFTKIVFLIAGVWGVCVTLPLYFLRDLIGRQSPPPITHPEFYYGFIGVTFTSQIIFLLIATDPARYRLMILPSILEKLSYVLANVALLAKHEMQASQAASSIPDFLLCLLFAIAFLRTDSTHGSEPFPGKPAGSK